jgi:hypothetical protein
VLYNIVTLINGEAVIDCLQTPGCARVGQVRMRVRQGADDTLAVKVGGECLTAMQGYVAVD